MTNPTNAILFKLIYFIGELSGMIYALLDSIKCTDEYQEKVEQKLNNIEKETKDIISYIKNIEVNELWNQMTI